MYLFSCKLISETFSILNLIKFMLLFERWSLVFRLLVQICGTHHDESKESSCMDFQTKKFSAVFQNDWEQKSEWHLSLQKR